MPDPAASRAPGARRQPAPGGDWEVVAPVPHEAPPPPAAHPTRGRPRARWTYREAAGAVLGHVLRFDRAEGGKDFCPLTWCRHTASGRAEWRWKAWPRPRPLYGLERLAGRPAAPVLICEGEKAAEAALELVPDHVAVTSLGGSKAAGRADWRPLAGRAVAIWPDADEAGRGYAEDVSRALTALDVAARIVAPPAGAVPGWDAADAIAEGMTPAQARALVEAARPTPDDGAEDANAEKKPARRRGRAPPQRDRLCGLIDEVEFWHDGEGEPFATVQVEGHLENWPVRARGFRQYLAARYFDETGGAPGGQALADAALVLAQFALRGPCHAAHLRVAGHKNKLYIDQGGSDWRSVEIRPDGWNTIDAAPVKFVRAPAMRALPAPEAGGSIDRLREFVNVRGAEDFKLVAGWLVGALHPVGPYPILVIGGEQGSAKSTLARFLVDLIDPRAAALRAMPRDERDLAIAAHNGRVLVFDNLSRVTEETADALCRLSSGGGFATRELHSDRVETIFDDRRPIILNGIPDLAGRPDLADRALSVILQPIAPETRRTESALRAEFETARPEILGALYDAASSALRHAGAVRLDRVERMADFALWVTAAEPGLGWEPGSFEAATRANREGAVELAVEHDAVAVAVRNFMAERDGAAAEWEGTATDLLLEFDDLVSEKIRKSRAWPATPAVLAGRLRRVAPALRQIDPAVDVQVGVRSTDRGRRRLIVLRRGL